MGENIQISLRIEASAAAVYKALTTTDQLETWFSDEVDVSLESKRFDFWGRSIPENPSHEDGRHPLLDVEPDRRLSFAWRMRDFDTVVAITLMPNGDNTDVELLHTNVPPRRPNDYWMTDFWLVSLENLRSWVERGVVGGRCDYAAPQDDGVTLELEIEAPAETVFSNLIEPEKLDRYMATGATVDPVVGGRYDFGWGIGGPVKIVELVPNERLAYQWEFEGEPSTLVTWSLEGSGGRTRLTLRHSGFGDDGSQEGYRTGWQHFLNYVKAMSEVGDRWAPPVVSNSEYAEAETV